MGKFLRFLGLAAFALMWVAILAGAVALMRVVPGGAPAGGGDAAAVARDKAVADEPKDVPRGESPVFTPPTEDHPPIEEETPPNESSLLEDLLGSSGEDSDNEGRDEETEDSDDDGSGSGDEGYERKKGYRRG